MKRVMLALLLVLAGSWGLAGQDREDAAARRPLRPALRQGPAGRRQLLQQRVVGRFMDRVTVRLGLDANQRQRLEQVLRDNEATRRVLAREARAVRTQLVRSAANPATSDQELERLMGQMSDLRARDLEVWRDEQAQLARVLTPRQRAQFMAMRLEFFEMVQRARQTRQQPLAEGAQQQP